MTTVTERDKLLHYIFTTALEGGIGYWSTCDEYHWRLPVRNASPPPSLDEDWHGFYASIDDDEDDGRHYRIDREVMERGYALATDPVAGWRRLCWSTEPPPAIVREHLDDWDYDACDADMIVQLGLFGDVKYG